MEHPRRERYLTKECVDEKFRCPIKDDTKNDSSLATFRADVDSNSEEQDASYNGRKLIDHIARVK